MDRVKYQSILNKLDKQDTAVPSTYENIVNTPIGNSTNRRPTDLENFYTQNRIREADSVNSIYNDPEYINWTSLDEIGLELDGIYIDMYGRQCIIPPKGLSIMNKEKYYRFN